MINRLKLSDICIITETKMYEAKIIYLEFVETPATDSSPYPMIGLHPKEKHIRLDKKYNTNTQETVLNELLQKLKEKVYEGTDYDGRLDYEFGWLEKPSDSDIRKLISKINIASNKIAMEGRIGPGHSIVFDTEYLPLFDKIEKNHGTMGLNFFHYPDLGDKVIVFRKNGNEQANWSLLYDNDLYAFEEIGDWSKQYNVLTLKCKKYLRQKKLQRILNEE